MDDLEIKEFMLKCNFALEKLKTEIYILNKDYEFRNKYNPVEHIKARLKTEESAIRKLEKKGYEVNAVNLINHVHDMVGIRIVCSFLPDVYEMVKLIKKSKQFKIKDEKDYIKNPKETGYVSYHLIVLVPIYLDERLEYIEAEIQIRTMAMDFWASLDHKIQYKFTKQIPEEIREEMYNCSVDIRTLDDKMEKLNEVMKKYNEN